MRSKTAPPSDRDRQFGTIIPVPVQASTLPACTDQSGVQTGCTLLTYEQRSQFCVNRTSYTLHAVPAGSTLTPINSNYTCNDEGVFSGDQLYSCYGPPSNTFQAQVCNATCTGAESDQCGEGLGLDPTGSCCMPVSSGDSSTCREVTLEIKDCSALR